MSATPVVFRPISEAGGAEVLGLDLRERLDERAKHALHWACHHYSLLVFRNQTLTWSDQFAFASIFGEVLENPTNASFVTSDGELWLHFDHWLEDVYPAPTQFTMLYGMEVVSEGGETVFASVRRAYECLPATLKRRLEGLTALHCYNYSAATLEMRIRAADLLPGEPCAVHPVVRLHPATGDRTLYVSPRNTDRILELGEEESEDLLQELARYIKAADNLYSHRWSVGDLLVWDNNLVLHGRTAYDATYSRRLRRACMR
jgi:taurine dioxygenase